MHTRSSSKPLLLSLFEKSVSLRKGNIYQRHGMVNKIKAGLILSLLCLGMALILPSSCTKQDGGLAIIDPVFALLSPEAVHSYKKAAGRILILPQDDPVAVLHAAIDAGRPEWVLLSPLLAPEIPAIRQARPDLPILILGAAEIPERQMLFSSVFHPEDAAHNAAVWLSGQNRSGICMGLFEGEGANRSAAAFMEGIESGPQKLEGKTRIISNGYSTTVARELSGMDISLVFLQTAPEDASRWLENAFDESALVALAMPFGYKTAIPGVKAIISWDLEKALKELVKYYREAKLEDFRNSTGKTGVFPPLSAPWTCILCR